MKEYDLKKAKRIIAKNKGHIVEADLGMREDWSWTAECIYKDGKFTENFKLPIAGIDGSDWATPTLQLTREDGYSIRFDCYKETK